MFKKVKLMLGKTVFQLVAVAVAITLVSGTAWAQDTSEETRKSRIIKQKKAKTSASASASDQEVKVEHKDGQVVIVTGDGVQHVIDLAKLEAEGNVIVQVQSEEKDGTAKSRGRAILVGPEGQQEVIFDTDAEGVLSFEFDELPGSSFMQHGDAEGVYQFTLNGNDFMIGINCDVADNTLKAHLNIDTGLVVKEVYEDSAARKAGVRQHDILIRANGEALENIDDLIEVIQEAGEEEDKVNLKIIRKGDRMSVEITPTKRENTFIQNSVIDLSEVDDNFFTDRAEIQRALPGLMLRQESTEDLAAEIAELREMIKQLRKEMKVQDKD